MTKVALGVLMRFRGRCADGGTDAVGCVIQWIRQAGAVEFAGDRDKDHEFVVAGDAFLDDLLLFGSQAQADGPLFRQLCA